VQLYLLLTGALGCGLGMIIGSWLGVSHTGCCRNFGGVLPDLHPEGRCYAPSTELRAAGTAQAADDAALANMGRSWAEIDTTLLTAISSGLRRQIRDGR
jgi:hypothetical protein